MQKALPGTSSMPGTGLTIEMKKTLSLPLISSQYDGQKHTTKMNKQKSLRVKHHKVYHSNTDSSDVLCSKTSCALHL